MEYLKSLGKDRKSFIMCLTESHLRDEIGDGEINIQGYTPHISDWGGLKEEEQQSILKIV